MKTIKIYEIIGNEVRSRSSIELIRNRMPCNENYFIIDMGNVDFISRSFADELYNLHIDKKEVHFVNKSDTVEKMLDVVWKGRNTKRVRNTEEVEIEDYTNIDDFFKFLKTI
ncbi:hypothetical protein [Prevotella intermedia]|uniref:STAS domain-containing protein n=1 Tax=Prevotella intermedia TaxID=28131 RepID=A0A2A6EDB3_PREIN|nr:hypothetical protein [Prevotella intermedia]PDP58412.1 hypothetical protein CLI71_11475 [Prevotella intermedia]